MSSKFSSKIIEHSNVCVDLTVASYLRYQIEISWSKKTQLLDLRRKRGKFNPFNMLLCFHSIRKITFQVLKVSNESKASKWRNQTKNPVLTYLSRVAHSLSRICFYPEFTMCSHVSLSCSRKGHKTAWSHLCSFPLTRV